jgi:Fe/S biogenesis protein NfuA
MSDPDGAPVLRLTDAARARVIELRAGEPDAASLGLWVEISGTSGDAFTYDMYFQAAADAEPADSVTTRGGLSIVIPADSMDNMRGALLDLSREVGQRGMVIQNPLVIQNPNQPPSRSSPAMGRPLADLSGDVAQRVVQVLDGQINPAIAAHGGHAELVAVEDDTAYLRLSGGLRRVRDGRGHIESGHRGGHLRVRARGQAGRRRNRPRGRHQPLLRGGQEVKMPGLANGSVHR